MEQYETVPAALDNVVKKRMARRATRPEKGDRVEWPMVERNKSSCWRRLVE